MSIVGPRPERPEFLEELEAKVPFWTQRQLIKPGITGWAQIRRGYTADDRSTREALVRPLVPPAPQPLVDFVICLQTFGVILRGARHRRAAGHAGAASAAGAEHERARGGSIGRVDHGREGAVRRRHGRRERPRWRNRGRSAGRRRAPGNGVTLS